MSPRRAALAVDVFTGLVIISVALALAGLTWRLLGDAGSTLPTAIDSGPVAPPPDVAPLLALAPFGRVSAAQAPATGLGIQLRGIVLAHPRAASTALISTAGGQPRPFAVGQMPAGGGVIEEIAVDHVLLRVNGRLEMLAFPKFSAAQVGGAPSPAVAVAPSAGGAALPPAPAPIAPPPPAPQALLDSLGASPSHAGYVVGPSPSTAMRRAGLQPGDVIEKINGTLVGNAERDRQLLNSSALSGGARIDVLRDGKRISFSIPLR